MLPKAHRLTKTKDVQGVARYGKGFRAGGIQLKALPQGGEKESRIAVVVSKKVSKKAVKRNRVRRLIQEAFWQTLPNLLPGYDLLVIVLPGMKAENLADVSPTVLALLKQAELLRDPL
ncbi:MAG: ribonuclease P protein component [Candidatus Yanofskybacteria bacterium]|nr:ribonuclease P protein component [Candidatus Yanofskybacteria bacterium]